MKILVKKSLRQKSLAEKNYSHIFWNSWEIKKKIFFWAKG
jgi:hypothetical protein